MFLEHIIPQIFFKIVMDSECLDEIKSLRPGCILSTRHLEKILETLLKLEERLEETCVIEFELFNLLASLAIDLKHEVIFWGWKEWKDKNWFFLFYFLE